MPSGNVTAPAYADFWLTVNGVDVPNSTIRWQSTKEAGIGLSIFGFDKEAGACALLF